MERRFVAALVGSLALGVCVFASPARGDTISSRGSVSQSVQFRVVIPELPPLVMKRGGQSISTGRPGARNFGIPDASGRQVAHVVDRHGRMYMRQTTATRSGKTILLAAP